MVIYKSISRMTLKSSTCGVSRALLWTRTRGRQLCSNSGDSEMLSKRTKQIEKVVSSSTRHKIKLGTERVALGNAFYGMLTKPARERFTPDRARKNEFTEERLRFQIPMMSNFQQPLDIAAAQGGVHVLTDTPIGVHSFYGLSLAKDSSELSSGKKAKLASKAAGRRKSKVGASPMRSWMPFDELLPWGSHAPQLGRLAARDKLILNLGKLDTLVVFSPSGGKCEVVSLPAQPASPAPTREEGSGDSTDMLGSIFDSMRGGKKRSKPKTVMDVSFGQFGTIVLHGDGPVFNSFDVLDFPDAAPGLREAGTYKRGDRQQRIAAVLPTSVQRVSVPVALTALEACSRGLWLARTASGGTAWIRQSDPADTQRSEFAFEPISKQKLSLEQALATSEGISLDAEPGFAAALAHAVTEVNSDDAKAASADSDAGSEQSGANQSVQMVHPLALLQSVRDNSLITVPRTRLEQDDKSASKTWTPVSSLWLKGTQQMASLVVCSDAKQNGAFGFQLVDEPNAAEKLIQAAALNVEQDELETKETKRASKKQARRSLAFCEMADGELAVLERFDSHGIIRTFQVDGAALEEQLRLWQQMLGITPGAKGGKGMGAAAGNDTGFSRDPLRLEVRELNSAGGLSASPPPIEAPKHGKEDPSNDPHVGGNTWAGGTGGSNTAGLGGRGGPYRLDKGHPVHQVSEEAKRQVDAATQTKARELNRAAFEERLQEIEMSEDQHEEYMGFYRAVEQEVAQMRSLLDSLESRKQERSWLKNQPFGELDDSKLVDGVTGDRLIFKRRGTPDKSLNKRVFEKKKRIRIVVDASASMYRFNGQDGRLQRECQLVVMLMEALDGFDQRFEYSIVAHSGESDEILLVDYNKPPRTPKERLKVVQHVFAHAQFCYSGDMTYEATEKAVHNVAEGDSDEAFVFMISDANTRRYGLAPRQLGRILTTNTNVSAYAIFIASIGDEAQRFVSELPPGRGFVVLDNTELPNLFRQIFITNVLT